MYIRTYQYAQLFLYEIRPSIEMLHSRVCLVPLPGMSVTFYQNALLLNMGACNSGCILAIVKIS